LRFQFRRKSRHRDVRALFDAANEERPVRFQLAAAARPSLPGWRERFVPCQRDISFTAQLALTPK
jgi:hypothetical protein